jgi:hypothetical protein
VRRAIRDGIESLAIGAMLGCADRRTLHLLDATLYRVLRDYRDDSHNLRGLMAWESAALAWFPVTGSVVVIGAGGGREAIALAGAGYRVVAYECNAALRRVANRLLPVAGEHAEILPLERDTVPPAPPRPFDAAIVGWSAYMLMIGRATRVRFMSGLRTRLAADAPVLLSFFTREQDDARLERIAKYANAIRTAFGRPLVEPGDDLAPTFVHRFTRAELDAELRDAGYRLVRFEPQGQGPEDSGWAVAVGDGASARTDARGSAAGADTSDCVAAAEATNGRTRDNEYTEDPSS